MDLWVGLTIENHTNIPLINGKGSGGLVRNCTWPTEIGANDVRTTVCKTGWLEFKLGDEGMIGIAFENDQFSPNKIGCVSGSGNDAKSHLKQGSFTENLRIGHHSIKAEVSVSSGNLAQCKIRLTSS